jgi:leucyl/phenylalanyl-tRNA--protein transferase
VAELGSDLIGVGADLEPSTLVQAYRSGLFPMDVDPGVLGWWSPDPRGVLPLNALRVSRSLRASMRHYEVSIDQAFAEVISACAQVPRPSGWITEAFIGAYRRLHDLGWAHSVETWYRGELVGGLYGVQIGGLFAGESMFHRRRDASKVALCALVAALDDGDGDRLLDVQWRTDHLASLGVVSIPRQEYLGRLARALRLGPRLA